MSKRRKGYRGNKSKWAAVNDHQAGAVQSGEKGSVPLQSFAGLTSLVRLLARQAAAEMFEEAANDNRQSSKVRPKE